jgi:protein gp37
MTQSKIEWTERVWNPTIGCRKVSSGCKNCYAELFAKRLQAMGARDYRDGFQFKMLPHRLGEPFKLKKPTKFFVNSMSDLFYEEISFAFLDRVFDVIKNTPQHIYQILTKRDGVMVDYFSKREIPQNVWLGVSVENGSAKARIDSLRKVEAKVRFVSFEPLIGSIGKINLSGIHWAIVGGESGMKARLMKKEWAEEIFYQCQQQGVAFFFKQWGTWGEDEVKRNKKVNGRTFLNKEWNEYPLNMKWRMA